MDFRTLPYMDSEQPAARVGHVVIPVDDVEAAGRVVEHALGLPPAYRRGPRWAAYDGGGGLMLALASAELVPSGQTTIGVSVGDLAAAAARLEAAGAVLDTAVENEDERRRWVQPPALPGLWIYEPKGPANGAG